MPAFLRSLLFFLVGAVVGAVAVLVFTPSFSVVVSRSAPGVKAVEVAVAPTPTPTPAVATVVPAAPQAAVPAATPPVAVAAVPAPDASAAEPAIDFKAIAEHLVLWPNTVTVKAATIVPVIVDGKKVQDLPLDAGTVLQVSKVLADGTLEARAKGAKFEIKSTLTDFSVELGKRVSELVAKGSKVEMPIVSAAPGASVAAAPVTAAPSVAAIPAATASSAAPATIAVPKGPLTLAQRVDILFGNKPEAPAAAAPAAPAAPASPVAPAASTAPAPMAAAAAEAAPTTNADPKSSEKGKDLDRKMNQLFK